VVVVGYVSGLFIVDVGRWRLQSPFPQDLFTERLSDADHGSRRHLCVCNKFFLCIATFLPRTVGRGL